MRPTLIKQEPVPRHRQLTWGMYILLGIALMTAFVECLLCFAPNGISPDQDPSMRVLLETAAAAELLSITAAFYLAFQSAIADRLHGRTVLLWNVLLWVALLFRPTAPVFLIGLCLLAYVLIGLPFCHLILRWITIPAEEDDWL